eukprot:6007023-Amphidinium_carterae.1
MAKQANHWYSEFSGFELSSVIGAIKLVDRAFSATGPIPTMYATVFPFSMLALLSNTSRTDESCRGRAVQQTNFNSQTILEAFMCGWKKYCTIVGNYAASVLALRQLLSAGTSSFADGVYLSDADGTPSFGGASPSPV